MQRKSSNNTIGVRTGKDILKLFKSKEKKVDGITHQAPKGEIEMGLFSIWSGLLRHENFGVNDNFFEIGGNSLKGVQVVSRISRHFEVNIELTDIFLHPTIAELAGSIKDQLKMGKRANRIPVQVRPNQVPLSFSQERLWFIDQFEGSLPYHVPAVLRLKGNISPNTLEQSLQTIVNRHEVLRTVFRVEEGQPSQYIQEKDRFRVKLVDSPELLHDRQGLENYIDELIRLPFDLSMDHMVRATLIRISEQEHIAVFVVHHIASDAWSLSILVNELIEVYAALVQGRPAILPVLELQYADYAIWQRNKLAPEVLEKKLQYWKEKLGGISTIQLPTDFKRPAVANSRGASTSFVIDKLLSEKLKLLAEASGTSLFMTLLAAFKVLLHHYSAQEDITVGTSIASRQQEELENLIGFFVNTLALRTAVKEEECFHDLLQAVKATTLEAYQNQDTPFEKVVDAVVHDREPGRSPLFQVMLVLHNTPEIPKLQLGDVELSTEPFAQNISKFDFTFFITDTPGGLQGLVEYSTELFREDTIVRMTGHFKELLASIVEDPGKRIGSLSLLSKTEQQYLLSFNDVQLTSSNDQTIVDLFEKQVAKTPGAIAIVFEEHLLTYNELNERANQLAHYLRSRGIKEDSLVPLCIERSPHMIIGLLGILKAGAAYVPVEPDFPEDRKAFMIQDVSAMLVVSSTQSSSSLPGLDEVEIIEMDNAFSPLRVQPVYNLQTDLRSHHLAYVIYTSGSTGKPKGVMIEHRNLVDYIIGLNQKLQIDSCKSYALVSSIATDLGNTVLYPSLIFGAALHVFSKDSISNIEYLHTYFTEHIIDCLKIVPSHWKVLSMGNNLLLPSRLLVFGGEALQSELIENIKSAGATCTIVNHYGPTETTIGKLLHIVERNRKYNHTIPIGRPFSKSQVYVLSIENKLCPVGVAGELHIAGDGVARGYLNNTALSEQKFIADPFDKRPGSRMYRTGDLVRWLADGHIEFIGRVDDQVKIRGYRVELGEIESTLLHSGLIDQAVVLAKDDKTGSKRLVGYILKKEDLEKETLLTYLEGRLPDYMVPAIWIEMEHFPLLPNGKIDRKSLPDPELNEELVDQYVAPQNETQIRLAEIWQEVLEVDQIGINDDFFELGGHSLLAVRLISAIRKAFVVEMPIGDIFDYPTVKGLAEKLQHLSGSTILPSIKAETRPQNIPLSFSQERLWFIDRLEGSVQYHVPAVLKLRGKLNNEALQQSLNSIVNRHEILRTVYLETGGKAYQFIKPENGWSLSYVDGARFRNDTNTLQSFLQEIINDPFDLANDYMLRAHLIKLAEQEQLLVVTLHHIASDAWSRSVLVNEVVSLYRSYLEGLTISPEPLPIQYADYALWQRKYLQGEVFDKKISYWKNKLENVIPLQLPTDHTRPAIWDNRGATKDFSISNDLSKQLLALSQRQGTTLFMTLLAAFKVMLFRYSRQQDICVGTAIAGRQQVEVEKLIGFFINTLALRSEVKDELLFNDLLQQVKTTTLEAYEHQEVPFEKVVELVVRERDLSRSPLAQVHFVLRNTPEIPAMQLGPVSMTVENVEQTVSKLDITFYLTETETGLNGSVEFATSIYNEATILRMIDHYKELLASIVNNPNRKIGELKMLTPHEEQQLLFDFNNTDADYPKDKSLVDLFEEQLARTPAAIAVVFEQQQLTYRQLNEKANQLAAYLRTKGVRDETLVPVCIERSLEMIIGILGILKAGAAYVPIDPEYPAERISYMLEDTQAMIVISSKESRKKLFISEKVEVIELDGDWKLIGNHPVENIQTQIKPHHLAYVIYTSGSTGKPKGVMNEHIGVVNRLSWAQDKYRLSANDAVLQKTTFSFDVSVWELLWPLLAGAKLVFAEPGGQKNNAYLKSVIESEKISMMHFVPSMLAAFLPDIEPGECKSLKKVLCSGEALKPSHVKLFREKLPAVELHNLYGPTEAAIDVTSWSLAYVDKEIKVVPIGRPVYNTRIHLLDKMNRLVPVGVPGELHIGGVQVARGYLNRPGLTSEKFIHNFFDNVPGSRLYKTGDLARWLPDGNIEYMGRLDDQVKIRGYRIELGEIEIALQLSGFVHQGIVLAREDKAGNKRLVGYVVPLDTFDKEKIVNYLKEQLPEYMVPALWVELKILPLTSNGKVDRKALPEPGIDELPGTGYIAAGNELEEKLVSIWQELLGIEKVGVHDNFFELGGDSILTIQVASQLKRSGHEMQPKDIFIHQTISKLSSAIILRSHQEVMAEQGVLTGPGGLLPIQHWYLDNDPVDIDHFNQSVLLGVDKTITAGEMEEVVNGLLEQHDALRFKYYKKNGQWQQEYGSAKGQINREDLRSATTGTYHSLISGLASKYHRSLDISSGQLIRVIFIQTPAYEKHNRLLILIHHLAIDGVSWRILLEDMAIKLNSLKNGKKKTFTKKSSSYRQFFEMLENYSNSERLLSQQDYWQRTIQEYESLPVDLEYAPGIQVKHLAQQVNTLGAGSTSLLLHEVPRVYHTVINDVLLCALAMTITGWTEKNNIIIGLEGHGRENIKAGIDTNQTVGWFTSLYPVLIRKETKNGIDGWIKSVKEQLRKVPDNGIGYGVLKYLKKDGSMQGKECWDIIFNYLGQFDTILGESGLLVRTDEPTGAGRSFEQIVHEKFAINCFIKGGELVVHWNYSTKHYHHETISKLLTDFISNLEVVINFCMKQQASGEVVYTPSDYGLGSEITNEELDRFLHKEEDNVDNIISF